MKTLKRLSLVVMAAILLCGTANAKIFNFGIKAGMNVNKLSFSKEIAKDLSSNENSAGWEAGVMAEVNVPIVGLCFDASVMYARMNNSSQAIFTNGGAFNGEEAGKNFIMIPVNIKYKFQLPVVSKYLVPYIFTGPDFAFKLDKNIISNMKSKTCQVAWNIGLGLQFFSHLQVGASYGFGINNIADKVMGTNTPDYRIKNNYWTVTAAWLF